MGCKVSLNFKSFGFIVILQCYVFVLQEYFIFQQFSILSGLRVTSAHGNHIEPSEQRLHEISNKHCEKLTWNRIFAMLIFCSRCSDSSM